MSKEDQLLGPVRGKRPLKDRSNNADPKQRRREKDSQRKRVNKKSYKEKAKRLYYQKKYAKDKKEERPMNRNSLVFIQTEKEYNLADKKRLMNNMKLV